MNVILEKPQHNYMYFEVKIIPSLNLLISQTLCYNKLFFQREKENHLELIWLRNSPQQNKVINTVLYNDP